MATPCAPIPSREVSLQEDTSGTCCHAACARCAITATAIPPQKRNASASPFTPVGPCLSARPPGHRRKLPVSPPAPAAAARCDRSSACSPHGNVPVLRQPTPALEHDRPPVSDPTTTPRSNTEPRHRRTVPANCESGTGRGIGDRPTAPDLRYPRRHRSWNPSWRLPGGPSGRDEVVVVLPAANTKRIRRRRGYGGQVRAHHPSLRACSTMGAAEVSAIAPTSQHPLLFCGLVGIVGEIFSPLRAC